MSQSSSCRLFVGETASGDPPTSKPNTSFCAGRGVTVGRRKRLVQDEKWAQDAQREINEGEIVQVRGPQRYNKLYKVTLSKSWHGLHEHLMDHALLKACMDELEHSGYSYKLPKGTVFSDAENYSAAIAAAGELENCHILVTKPFLKALKKQLELAPRVNRSRVNVRGVKLLANFFGPEGAELRTITLGEKPVLLAD